MPAGWSVTASVGPTSSVVRAAFAVLGAIVFVHFAASSLRAIRFPFPIDYGEGPLLEQAQLLASGQNIYRPHAADGFPFTVANYPPIFPGLLALVGRVFGFGYGVACGVNTVAVTACAALVARIVSTSRGGNRLAGWVAATAFLASPYVAFWSTLVRVDFLALAFLLCAILVVLRKPEGRATPLWAGALVGLAVMTRQSHLLAGPGAIAGALLARGRRPAALFILVLGAFLGAAVVALETVTHGGFLFDTVRANENCFSWAQVLSYFRDLSVSSPVLLAVAGWLAAARLRPTPKGGPDLLALYLVGSALSAFTIGKIGAHVNYLLELTAALSIFAGLAMARMGPGWKALLPLVLFAQIGWLEARTLAWPMPLDGKLRLRGEFAKLEGILERERGPVLADETMGILVLASHPILLQPFEFTQLVREGAWDEGSMLREVRERSFAIILVNDGPHTPPAATRERWTEPMLAAIHQAYEPEGRLAEATLYRPRLADP